MYNLNVCILKASVALVYKLTACTEYISEEQLQRRILQPHSKALLVVTNRYCTSTALP